MATVIVVAEGGIDCYPCDCAGVGICISATLKGLLVDVGHKMRFAGEGGGRNRVSTHKREGRLALDGFHRNLACLWDTNCSPQT